MGRRLWKTRLVGALVPLAFAAGAAAGAFGLLAGLSPAVAAGRARPASAPPVPARFVGVVVDGPVYPDTDNHIDLGHQLDVMVANGVMTIRVEVDWAAAQPYRNWSGVPAAQGTQFVDAGGVPTDFGPLDQIVGLAAQRGITVLPDILNAPRWDAVHRRGQAVAIPRSDAPYASFVKVLVARYGPGGTFWQSTTPSLPIREWQIWNEPNIYAFWPIQPFQSRYLGLLRATRGAIKSVDPGAKIVLGGLPNYSWVQLRKLYSYRGARGLFDVVAVHPYTKTPQGVITILTKVRQVMNAAGDRNKPMIADEISWPSSRGKTPHNTGYDFATTPAGQARNIASIVPMLASHRASLRLSAFYYYTWAAVEDPHGLAFGYSGLFRYSSGRFIAKPALSAFSRAVLTIEHCRKKGQLATICAQPG